MHVVRGDPLRYSWGNVELALYRHPYVVIDRTDELEDGEGRIYRHHTLNKAIAIANLDKYQRLAWLMINHPRVELPAYEAAWFD